MALLDDCVAYWRLGEASGSRADSVGSNTLTDNNTVGSTTGKLGNAANFIAANSEYLNIADNAALSMPNGQSFTIAMWINPSTLTNGATPLNKGGLIFGASSFSYALEFLLQGMNVNLLWILSNNTASSALTCSAGVLPTSTWSFVVAWYDNSDNFQHIQLNNGTPVSIGAPSGGSSDQTFAFNLGSSGAGGAFFNGAIDDTLIWKRVLTSDERSMLWNGGAGRSPLDNLMPPPVTSPAQASRPTLTRSFAAGVPPGKAIWLPGTPMVPRNLTPPPARVTALAVLPIPWGSFALRPPPAIGMLRPSVPRLTLGLRAPPSRGVFTLPSHAIVSRMVMALPAPSGWRTPAPRLVLQQPYQRLLPTLTRTLFDEASGGISLAVRAQALALASVPNTTLIADWLIQVPSLDMYYSYAYNPDGTWEHRILSIGDVDLSVQPGGGLSTVGDMTVVVAEDGSGASPLATWNGRRALEGREITLSVLLDGDTTPLRIFTGHITRVTIQNGEATIQAVDDSLRRNLLLPKSIVTQDMYPQASSQALNRPIALVYGLGSRVGGAPALLVDTVSFTYLVAAHALGAATTYAILDRATNTFQSRTGDATFGNGAFVLTHALQEFRFASLTNTLRVIRNLNATNDQAVLDTDTSTIARIATSTLNSNLDGYGYFGIGVNFGDARGRNTVVVTATGHRRGASSATTVTGQFIIRTIDPNGTVLRDNLFVSPEFRHASNPRTNTFTITALQVGTNEALEVYILAINEGGVGGPNDYYEIQGLSIEGYYQPEGDDPPLFLYNDWQGRLDTNGTLTGSATTLLTTPSDIIGDLLVNELEQPIAAGIFQAARAYYLSSGDLFDGGIGGLWAVERAPARELLQDLAFQARAILFADYEANWRIEPYTGVEDTLIAITQDDILTIYGSETTAAAQRPSSWQLTLGDLTTIYHRFEVHYAYNTGTRKYDKVLVADSTGSNVSSSTTNEMLTILCQNSFHRYGLLPPLVVEAYMIYDDDTAAALLEHLVTYFWSQRLMVECDLPLQRAATLLLGSRCSMTHPLLPESDDGTTFEVHRLRFSPSLGRVGIALSRVASITFDVLCLQDSANVRWCFWIDTAGQIVRDTALPDYGGALVPTELITGTAPSWLEIADSTGVLWYVYPDLLGQLVIDATAPSAGFGLAVGTAYDLVGVNAYTYTIGVETWQTLKIELTDMPAGV